jgi:hypothetical protein
MTDTLQPAAGLIGLSPISGFTGKFIELSQWLCGEGFRQWEHAFVSLGGGLIAQAQPGGAVVAELSSHPVVYWCERIGYHLTPDLQAVASAARRYTQPGPWGPHGVPYSFLDYDALALHHLGIPAPFLQSYIKSTMHQICSQLCSQSVDDTGSHLFSDDRWAGDVMPADIYNRDIGLPPVPQEWRVRMGLAA